MDIKDRRALVIGASSGAGRDIGESLAARGARVAFAARRGELVEEAAQAAGDRCIGLACDVREDASCDVVVADAVAALGGLDTLIYAAAIGILTPLDEASASMWRETIDVNLIGASLVTRAAIGHLEASGAGRAIYLSSVSGSTSTPWPSLSLYAVSKAALERAVDGWRVEHPGVRFSSVVLGPIMTRSRAPSTFANSWDAERAAQSIETWTSLGLMDGGMIDADDLCAQVIAILTTSASIPRVVLEP